MRFAGYFSLVLALCLGASAAQAADGDRCVSLARDLVSKPNTQLLSVLRSETGCRIVYLERNSGKRARRLTVQVPYAPAASEQPAVEEGRVASSTIASTGK